MHSLSLSLHVWSPANAWALGLGLASFAKPWPLERCPDWLQETVEKTPGDLGGRGATRQVVTVPFH